MQQSHTVLLEYHKPESQGAVGYWTRTEAGRETKYVRVLCGLAKPKLDREAAALIAIGEMMRSFAPPDFTGLAAVVGSWPEVKSALLQACRDLKPESILVQDESTKKLVSPLTDPLAGKAPVVPSTWIAPPHSLTELGRQNVEQLINEGRLHIEHLLDVMDQEKDQADAALRLAVNYALEFTAFYPGKKRGRPEYKRLWGEF